MDIPNNINQLTKINNRCSFCSNTGSTKTQYMNQYVLMCDSCYKLIARE